MKEKKFECDEEILKWLTEKNLSGIIKGINQNNGIINEKIASVIYCKSFIKKFKDDYNKIFNSLGFKILKITDEYIYISYIDSDIEFFISSSEFMRRYARLLFNNKNTISDSILDKFKLVNNEENINKFIERCNNILENSQYKLKSEIKDGKISNIMNIFKGDFLAKVNAEIFTRNIKKYLIKINEEAKNNTIAFIERINTWNKVPVEV
ncbi:MAG: hypothetical protein MJ191_07160 [Clostridium sp.]|nr:hypothetical protein [Clostridium sp.]